MTPDLGRGTQMGDQIRILMLEDEPDDEALLRAHLRQAGLSFSLHRVKSRSAFQTALEEGGWDLILADWSLPGFGGVDALEVLRESGRDIPFMVISDSSSDDVAAEAMQRGARDFLQKGRPTRLVPAIRRELKEARARRRSEATLREQEARYAMVLEGTSDGLWDWDLVTEQVYFSPRWKQQLGYSRADLSSSASEWMDRIHPEDLPMVKEAISRTVKGLEPSVSVEHRVRNRYGSYRWMLARGNLSRDAAGQVVRLVGTQTDITARKLTEDRLAHAASHDPLTGLPNRALFMDRLRHAIRRYHRASDQRFCVLFVDLDRFRLVVDSLGHVAGDEMLMKAAHRISGCLRPGDTVARFGGNIFTLLLEDIEDIDDATGVAARIQLDLTRPLRIHGVDVYARSSIGVKLSTDHEQTAEEILKDADTALSRAKSLGGGRVAIFDSRMSVEATNRLLLETDLRQGLERREFVPSYQPIVDLGSGRVSGAEVLVRWHHPTRGVLLPSAFLPVAEETGLILPMDWQTLEQAITDLKGWSRAIAELDLLLSVNLSARHFNRTDLVERLRFLCDSQEVDPRRFKLEITETAILDSTDSTADQLHQLREMGFHLCLDDFGTGYSPLGNLYRLPIDTLKIDRSFVSHMTGDKHKTEIVRSIVNLARSLEKSVIAEGVETREQRLALVQMDCELGQGWLFSRAVDAAAMEALLKSGVSFPRG